jgi:hypothetical protein
MPWQFIVTTIVIVALILLPFALLYLRRRWLTGQGGLFDCAHRVRDDTPGHGWALGVARYRGENLEWFRSFSLGLTPKLVLQRAGTTYVHQRKPEGLEAIALFADSIIVTVKDRVTGHLHTLAMSRDEVLALMSWLESAPPGSHYLPGSADSPR